MSTSEKYIELLYFTCTENHEEKKTSQQWTLDIPILPSI
jgi:hypothetical protein